MAEDSKMPDERPSPENKDDPSAMAEGSVPGGETSKRSGNKAQSRKKASSASKSGSKAKSGTAGTRKSSVRKRSVRKAETVAESSSSAAGPEARSEARPETRKASDQKTEAPAADDAQKSDAGNGESAKKPVEAFTPGQERFGRFTIRIIGRVTVWIYRLSRGRLLNRFLGGPVALVTTTGRRSGKKRTTPVVYCLKGDNVILVASQGGMSKHPLWYLNMKANPEVRLQIGGQARQMMVRRLEGKEEEEAWRDAYQVYPAYEEYRQRAGMRNRQIPILLLEPVV